MVLDITLFCSCLLLLFVVLLPRGGKICGSTATSNTNTNQNKEVDVNPTLLRPTKPTKEHLSKQRRLTTEGPAHIHHNMPHTYSGKKRTKRPDFRPNGKRRLKAQQKEAEKDRLARVAANEMKGKLLAPPRHEKLPPLKADGDDNNNDRKYYKKGQVLRREKRQQPPEASRIRSLHKLLRQIVALEEKQKTGATLNEAQLTKLGRFDDVVAELEELQRVDDESEVEEVDNGSDNESEEQEEDEQEEKDE